jgi:hypothetical protein
MTERDKVLDEVIAAIRAMSGSEWCDDPNAQRQEATAGQTKAILARVEAMKSEYHVLGA